MKRVCILFVAIFILAFILPAAVSAADNLVLNPSFEENDGEKLVSWETDAWVKDPGATVFSVANEGHTGDRSASVENALANEARFKQNITVESGKTYRLSCWIKNEIAGETGKGPNISIESKFEMSNEITAGSTDWQYAEIYAKIGENVTTMRIMVGIGGYGATNTGKALFDDVTVEAVDSVPDGAIIASIGAAAPGPVIPAGTNDTPKTVSGPDIVLIVVLGLIVVLIFVTYAYYLIRINKKTDKPKPEGEN